MRSVWCLVLGAWCVSAAVWGAQEVTVEPNALIERNRLVGHIPGTITRLGLIHEWTFDTGTSADTAGSFSGTDANISYVNTGAARKTCATFNGSTSLITLGDMTTINALGAMTISAWVYLENRTVNITIHHRAFTRLTSSSYATTLDHPRNAAGYGVDDVFGYLSNGSIAYWYTTTNVILANKVWYHTCIVFDGAGTGNAGRLKFFFNGQPQTLGYSGTIPVATPNISAVAYIGGPTTIPWYGRIDNLRIYNRALTVEEITDLYNVEKP